MRRIDDDSSRLSICLTGRDGCEDARGDVRGDVRLGEFRGQGIWLTQPAFNGEFWSASQSVTFR